MESKKLTSRAWCFTLNNYVDSDIDTISKVECVYLVVGKEIGEQGTKHLQGFIVFLWQKTMSSVKKCFNNSRVHLEIKSRYSTFVDASNYCKKGTDVNWKGKTKEWVGKDWVGVEKGELPMDQTDKGELGKRRWETILESIKEGKDAYDLVESHMIKICEVSAIQRNIETYKKLKTQHSMMEKIDLPSKFENNWEI